ncbi:hypothetical protein BHE74_00053694 [Ensete ventricosum]|nr:hypothetical protein BHE74_00053694 [Ensete ventricosum]RZS25374.1 hypothetical protein BHM03_00058565 [Ensete ventricosum]
MAWFYPCAYREVLHKEASSIMGRAMWKAVEEYKETIRYWVALARFLAWYPDLEIKEDPFTIRPEDNSVPMEDEQSFDDLVPPEL